MLAPPPLLPPPPPEFPPPELELDLELEEVPSDAEELAEEEAALPAALMVAVSSGNLEEEAGLDADTECTLFAWPELLVIKGLILDGEDDTAEISTISSLPEGLPP
jgi:hypothetical protein